MKKIILATIAVSSLYARSYIYDYSCDSLYSDYKESYYDISHSNYFRYDTYCKELGKKLDRSIFSSPEEEARANEEYLKHQQLTLGIACEQIIKKIPVYYKKDYCAIFESKQVAQQAIQATAPNLEPKKQIDPAIQYKNTPQLKLSKLHIYGITNIEYFRDKKNIIMVESSTGNFALPLTEIVNAERINFTTELSQKINDVLR
ncbi:MAG: hypothetical protein M0P91_09520 [Sulfuricurvum sp.]|jgi:hypothetical protein|uniref:hypothetical protein n=1 Tax=Sulfuricurvum sp. TaxID=2025608 RepID=UPI0025F97822|nr:hypothetical protein [Sulfuricurvum sp.]MCK9373426.1 hypothetical protein [Sulfuricurvum sp.]